MYSVGCHAFAHVLVCSIADALRNEPLKVCAFDRDKPMQRHTQLSHSLPFSPSSHSLFLFIICLAHHLTSCVWFKCETKGNELRAAMRQNRPNIFHCGAVEWVKKSVCSEYYRFAVRQRMLLSIPAKNNTFTYETICRLVPKGIASNSNMLYWLREMGSLRARLQCVRTICLYFTDTIDFQVLN